jgi:NAD(P)-dependent dehydrogenase (short-subunit alcohol dehydrogenase family)
LDRKVAVVTGAGGRGNSIGRAYAQGLAKAGARVVVVDIKARGAQRVAADIVAVGGEAIGLGVDITKPDSVRNMAEVARDAFGGVDILVNNAALMAEPGHLPAVDIPHRQWNRIMDVNVTGALNCVQAIVPLMRQRGGGKIVNQISGAAFPAVSVYGVSKLALLGLTTTLARQLAREKINVNAIAPGDTTGEAGRLPTPAESPFVKALEATVAMRLRGHPDELVGALLLLCSSAGDRIAGQVLHVDGGWILRP